MNILFCNTSDVSEIKGGTERITARISKGLTDKGHQCFLAYKTEIDAELPLTPFVSRINVYKASLEDFILKYHIDVVIIQKMTRDVKIFSSIREQHHLDLKIISVLHFNPGYELKDMSMSKALRILRKESNGLKNYVKNTVRVITYPFYRMLYPLRDKELYRNVYQYSDRVVLLSAAFIDEYADYCGLKDINKFVVIPNALSYDEFFPVEKLCEKKKQALIVSRLVPSKRVDLALKVWSEIERDGGCFDWNLVVVGDGRGREHLENQKKALGLQQVELVGRQNPKSYYQESRIFIMTSAHEGWGLTITEAQQMGCVPIAFDSFSSLKDIITDKETGYIVKDCDLKTYIHRIKLLMSDNTLRLQMAGNAISSCKRFQLDAITSYWETLILE